MSELLTANPSSAPAPPAPSWRWLQPVFGFAQRWPFATYLLLGIALNLVGTVYNLVYNSFLVVGSLDKPQADAFWYVVVPLYNPTAWTICLVLIIKPLVPLMRCWRDLLARRPVTPRRLEESQRLLVNLPRYQVWIIFWGWMLGGICFPLGICLLGGWQSWPLIWVQFLVSFFISALVSATQTFFVQETFLIKFVYPTFFKTSRPCEVLGARHIPLRRRLFVYAVATVVVPVAALLMIALNATAAANETRHGLLRWMALGVAAGGIACSGLISWLIGRDLVDWVQRHTEATDQIREGNYDIRLLEKRPDEFGNLTDRFNDMVERLHLGRVVRETFGEFVGPELVWELLQQGIGGELHEITVLFADIRGFTRRSAGASPEQVVALLNRFFTLAVSAIEEQSGSGLKFLGDGLMALFGVPRSRADHADLAVQAACSMLKYLGALNAELAAEGQAPLRIGIGIHTGPAVVGCIGATLNVPGSRPRRRREYSAIGETVNLCQRIEQLTKTCGCPILISEQTRACLRLPVPLTCHGPQEVHGYEGTVVVHELHAG